MLLALKQNPCVSDFLVYFRFRFQSKGSCIDLGLVAYLHHKNGHWTNECNDLLRKCISKHGIMEKVNFTDLVKDCVVEKLQETEARGCLSISCQEHPLIMILKVEKIRCWTDRYNVAVMNNPELPGSSQSYLNKALISFGGSLELYQRKKGHSQSQIWRL